MIIHVDRLRPLNDDRCLWFIRYPLAAKPSSLNNDTRQSVSDDLIPTPLQHQNSPPPDQTSSTNSQPQSKTQDQASNLSQNWYQIDRILARKRRRGITYFHILWSDLDSNGHRVKSWEPQLNMTPFALKCYELELNKKRGSSSKRRKRKNS
jgi:hypothetical protein